MLAFYSKKTLPVYMSINEKGIHLPSSPNIMNSDVKYICKLIAKTM